MYISKRIGNRVGKKMMGCLYIHKSAIDTLSIEEMDLYKEKVEYIDNFEYDILKINLKDKEVSFIQSPDWDILDEPSVGDSIKVNLDNTISKTKGSNLIYHHKWQFVKDDYSGFDVTESKKRSELWMNHPEILKLKDDETERFNSKIGRRNYWVEKVCKVID